MKRSPFSTFGIAVVFLMCVAASTNASWLSHATGVHINLAAKKSTDQANAATDAAKAAVNEANSVAAAKSAADAKLDQANETILTEIEERRKAEQSDSNQKDNFYVALAGLVLTNGIALFSFLRRKTTRGLELAKLELEVEQLRLNVDVLRNKAAIGDLGPAI
jgi:hypothetical protein